MMEGRDTRMEIEIERTRGKGVMEEYTESQMQMGLSEGDGARVYEWYDCMAEVMI